MDGTIPKAYQERLHFELDVIKKVGFAGYFLVVWDFVRYGRENQIPVGPGRGSVGGSLAADHDRGAGAPRFGNRAKEKRDGEGDREMLGVVHAKVSRVGCVKRTHDTRRS